MKNGWKLVEGDDVARILTRKSLMCLDVKEDTRTINFEKNENFVQAGGNAA